MGQELPNANEEEKSPLVLHHAAMRLKEFYTYSTGNVLIRKEPHKAQGAFSTIETCLKECTEQENHLCTAERFKCLLKAFPYKKADGTITPIGDVWWGVPLDKFPGTKDQPLPSMIGDDCILHVLLGASVGRSATTQVAVVEMGTFLGAGSVCNAAGLALAKSKTVHYHAFDFFKVQGVKDGNFHKLYVAEEVPAIAKLMVSDDLDYEKIWNAAMTNVYPRRLVHSHAGFIGTEVGKTAADWDNAAVGLFVIDSAKRYKELVIQSHAAWSSFRPGSVVVFSDFTYRVACKDGAPTVPGFVYSQLVETGLFQLLLDFPKTSEVAFEVTDKYDPSKGEEYLNSYKEDVDWDALSTKMISEFKALHQSRGYADAKTERIKPLMECDMTYAASKKNNVPGI